MTGARTVFACGFFFALIASAWGVPPVGQLVWFLMGVMFGLTELWRERHA